MEVLGYHACQAEFAEALRSGAISVSQWQPSQNDYDWLGHGIYFWEGSIRRAQQWAHETRMSAIVEARIDLVDCFDLVSFEYPELLAIVYAATASAYEQRGWQMPTNGGREGRLRKLDCLIINEFIAMMDRHANIRYQTVRCPFEEGAPIFPGSMIRGKTHIQIAVRDPDCITLLRILAA